ncbi:hemeolysin E [Metarhizium robertsii ARSEF 23]|uniref:Hemeolysin E n=1 Tax=Metarhizium robertsii (strain ARSEF 23 / ATCC MYA-3075) TaxID=655844 RepID=E9FAQ7_METRA|nr:hemeolysin E [Metarhizium robertsii ARSEF 23]EFY95151.2 hemeolysin E [Metarhizium robertsii ARSEF 23]
MTGFDPRQPITDPSVFSPRGMYVDNRSGNKGTQDDDDDDVKAFVFDASDMKALNRFLGTGRKLQTTRSEYLRWLGISDTPGEISAALGKELESLLKTYTSIKSDCTQFKDVTWNRIVDIAGDIKSYATMSGGKESTSYYVLMLKFIGDYHEENKKPNPDKAKLAELKESIQFTVDAELKKLGELQAGAQEALTGLGAFERVCEQHGLAVETNANSLEAQLKKEGNDIETMKKKIEEARAEIDDLQGQIDGKNQAINDAPKYMWVITSWPIGTAIGTGIVVEAKKAIKRLKEAMEKVKKVLDDYESKMKTASRLETNLKFISKQVKDLGTEIGPAIKTLQKLQGAWKSMETDLSAIKDLIEFDTDNIPPMLITRPQLQGIVDEWNELKDYASNYIENAYISDEPKAVSIAEYISELEDAIMRIEAMEKGQ